MFAMESYLPGLDLSVLLIDLVAHQHYRNIFHYPRQVLVPFGHIFVGDSAAHIEHQDSGMSLNIVALP